MGEVQTDNVVFNESLKNEKYAKNVTKRQIDPTFV